jgi:dipeptidyl aminopeptidase/acylaminoacyl peptidase
MSRRSAFEDRLRRELHTARPPRAADAERRAWRVVRAAHAARPPARARWRGARLALAAAGAALAAGALALTPAGARMGDWIDDVVSPAPEATRSLSSLPAPGRLLVVADGGAWVFADNGARRQLGGLSDATWSPRGWFVAGARGRELVALDPQNRERWSRPTGARVSVPRWSPDGYRIAYRSGSDLRVAIGDNTDDWRLARGVGATPPAWKPVAAPAEQVLAFATGGRISIVGVDSRQVHGRTPPGPPPRELWWADGGRRLVAVTSTSVRVHGPRGRLLRTVRLPYGSTAAGSALAPDGRRLAIVTRAADRGSSRLLLLRLDRPRPPRSLFSSRGSFEGVAWSVDGSLLVVGVPRADQWLFVRPEGSVGLDSVVRGIRERFEGGREPRTGAFPRPAGWCDADPQSARPRCSLGSAP